MRKGRAGEEAKIDITLISRFDIKVMISEFDIRV